MIIMEKLSLQKKRAGLLTADALRSRVSVRALERGCLRMVELYS